jgi:APA family basic amino acid/polyamine antiporter
MPTGASAPERSEPVTDGHFRKDGEPQDMTQQHETAPPASAPDTPAVTLVQHMGLWTLVLYGIGDMLGSGIYALIGKAAGMLGSAIWLAFGVSMVAALLTALSYASLGSRYPRAAGAAYVTHRAFGKPFLSYVVGLAVMASGLTSMGTQSRAFSEYFSVLVPGVPVPVLIVGFIALLTLVNFWGIRESTWLNIICTSVEVSGLVIVIVLGLRYWGGASLLEVPPVGSLPGVLGPVMVLQGAVLTFYSFVGFEDMINVVEEVKDPQRTFPRAIVLAMIAVTLIYLAVSVSAVSVLPWRELAASKQPLVDVVTRAAPGFPPLVFSLIALFAITNTALLNYIMGSRLAYGMARQGLLPRFLGTIHPTRRTPHLAIWCLMAIVLVLGLGFDIKPLAKATSVLLMAVFVLINGALLVLQRRKTEARGFFEVPSFVPAGGLLVSLVLLVHAKPQELELAACILLAIIVLYFAMRPRGVTEETFAEAAHEAEEAAEGIIEP